MPALDSGSALRVKCLAVRCGYGVPARTECAPRCKGLWADQSFQLHSGTPHPAQEIWTSRSGGLVVSFVEVPMTLPTAVPSFWTEMKEEPVKQGADHRCAEGASSRDPGCGALPEAWDQRRDLLQLAHPLRPDGGVGRPAAEDLEDENRKLKKLLGESMLDFATLREALRKRLRVRNPVLTGRQREQSPVMNEG